jgi:hypothetical protein
LCTLVERKPVVSLAPPLMPTRSRVRRCAAALAAGALALGLGGCTQTGFEAQTNASYDPGVGSNEAFGDVAVLAALVVDNDGESGTLSATLTRRTDEEVQLTGVTAKPTDPESDGTVEVEFPEPVDIPSNRTSSPLLLTELPEPIVLSGDPVIPGRVVDLAFEFSDGHVVELAAPVVERGEDSGLYENVPGPASSEPATVE